MATSSLPPASATAPWRLLRWAIDELVAPRTALGPPFNPLCLISAHAQGVLLGDIASHAEATGATVLRRCGREFADEVGQAIAKENQDRLLERFASADVVVVENLDAIGDSDLQALACQLFDASGETGTLWCVGLSRPPEAAGLDRALVTRLVGGLVIMLPTRVTMSPKGSPKISTIIAATARQFDLTVSVLTGARRSRHVAGARSLAMYLARELTGASYGAIGRACGGRDHTTAMHATRKIAAAISRDTGLADDAAAITARVG